MQTRTTQHARLTLFAFLLGALMLSGCGARKTARSSGITVSSSRTVSDIGAACNHFYSKDTHLEGKISIYTMPDGGEAGDIVRVRITGINDQFNKDSNYVIKMYRWKTETSGVPEIDKNPLQFRAELPGSNGLAGIAMSGYMTDMNLQDMISMKDQYAVSANNVEEFLQKVDLLVFNVDYTWDVLRIAIFKNTGSTTSELIGFADMLMPRFSADPNTYAKDHSLTLAELHPFWAERTSTNYDYAAMAESFCF